VVQLEDEFVAPPTPVKRKKTSSKAAPKGSAKKAKKGMKKDGTPKAARGKSAFMFFSIDARPKVKDANPDMAFGEIAKEIGAQWNKLAASGRVKFEKLAAADKAKADKVNAKK
jgi:hypothetical protein